MIDFAGDLARLYSDPLGFTEEASYAPASGAPSIAIRVKRRAPDEVGDIRDTQIWTETTVFDVPCADVAEPLAGDRITVGAETFVVQGKPTRDSLRLVWRLDTRPA